jgi:DNA invertase Pin-like site-specific DNA recombinase
MSTEHQRYSTENQADAIAQYATRWGFEIVRTYADHGKSGLRLEGRDALRQLLSDVHSGNAGFKAILVYDVSRWGRFQDADESAYYEYICRRSGIEVRYCAEQFENDGSIASTIVKTVKRAMAGEYSRELSAKVFAGQSRLIELGFRQGGAAGYGLRRRLLDQNGQPKAILGRGEHKSLQTERVVLEPGPPEEVETVRRMFRLLINEGRSPSEIADILNSEGLTTDHGLRWASNTVHSILTNEKYIGNNVFNRVSFKLKKKLVVNTPDMWIRAVGAFPAIVDKELFQAAQAVLAERQRRLSDAEMLDLLRRLQAERGALSTVIIDETKGMPSTYAYRQRFGSVRRAYQLIGYLPRYDFRYLEANQRLRRMHAAAVDQVLTNVAQFGGRAIRDSQTDLLTINGEFTSSIVVARCTTTAAGSWRWNLRLDTALRPDITVALRMTPENREPLDYYLLPQIDIRAARLRLADRNGVSLDAYRFDSLDALFRISARTPLRITA